MAAGLGGQLALVTVAVILPLVYTDQLPQFHLSGLHVWAPAGRPAPAGNQSRSARSKAAINTNSSGKIYVPVRYDRPLLIADDAAEISASAGDFVVGALPGAPSTESGVLARVSPSTQPPPPPPVHVAEQAKPAVPPQAPIAVGGHVQEAKIIRRVIPAYPEMARRARVAGIVQLVGVIGRDGHVEQLRVTSGHVLLVSAAVDAVRQWIYRPTLLNGQPVEVIAPIEVRFTLQ